MCISQKKKFHYDNHGITQHTLTFIVVEANENSSIQAQQALAWWLRLMPLNEEVMGSIPHTGVVPPP